MKWAGFPENEATWQPEKDLEHCQDLVHQFLARQASPAKRPSKTKPRADAPKQTSIQASKRKRDADADENEIRPHKSRRASTGTTASAPKAASRNDSKDEHVDDEDMEDREDRDGKVKDHGAEGASRGSHERSDGHGNSDDGEERSEAKEEKVKNVAASDGGQDKRRWTWGPAPGRGQRGLRVPERGKKLYKQLSEEHRQLVQTYGAEVRADGKRPQTVCAYMTCARRALLLQLDLEALAVADPTQLAEPVAPHAANRSRHNSLTNGIRRFQRFLLARAASSSSAV